MKASAVERKTCRLCGSAMLEKVMSLVPTPLGDDFIPACRPIKVQECFPLELMLCRSCGNVQLLHVVDPETVCPEHTYRSSISLELPEHFQRYANDLIQRVPLSEESLVVDIGSHEKMLLRSFKDKARILGIDPDPGIAR